MLCQAELSVDIGFTRKFASGPPSRNVIDCLQWVESGRQAPYKRDMLNAGVFDEFKGATTLLLWGDEQGMAALFAGLSALREGTRSELTIDGADTCLTVRPAVRGTELSTPCADHAPAGTRL